MTISGSPRRAGCFSRRAMSLLDKVHDLASALSLGGACRPSRRVESLDERIRRGVGREMTMADIDGLGPYFQPRDAVHAGCRDQDEHLIEVSGLLAKVVPASVIVGGSAGAVAEGLSATLNQFGVGGYWLHLDVDILDPGVMPAVDSPDSGGLGPDQLTELLAVLAPGAVGAQVTVFDPDLDSDGRLAGLLTEIPWRLTGTGA